MKALSYLLFVWCSLFCCRTYAQDSLSIRPNALDSVPFSTFTLGNPGADTGSFHFWLYNRSSQPFSDQVSFDCFTRVGGVISIVYHATEDSIFSFPYTAVTIQPHDSVLLSMGYHINSPEFIANTTPTVVIWPVLNSAVPYYILDSAARPFTILGATGIADLASEYVKAYMSGDNLILKNDMENPIGSIRIYNEIGEVMAEEKISQHFLSIPLQPYAGGAYVAEVILSDGSRLTYRFIKLSER